MKQAWSGFARCSLCALALVGASLVSAQTSQSMEHVAPMHDSHPMDQKMHKPESKKQHMQEPKGKQPKSKGDKPKRDKSHGPKGTAHAQQDSAMNDYERNALRRCEVFKNAEDRAACVARVRQPSLSGSVESGGVIRHSTQPGHMPMKHPKQKSN